MIVYFSGTGNSEYAAQRIGSALDDEVINLFDKIRERDYSDMSSQRPWVIVVPTYAWRIPRIVHDWLEKTSLCASKQIYFVMTCGGDIGNAGKYLEPLCGKKNMDYCGCAQIVMPENYIAMFATPTEDKALQIIAQAESTIDSTILAIKNGEKLPKREISFGDKMNSSIINELFYPMFVHAKKFYATEGCICCGKCAKVCPLKNIRIENGKPKWGGNCTHCMACICKCPSQAIEYGNHSKGLPRYTCPK